VGAADRDGPQARALHPGNDEVLADHESFLQVVGTELLAWLVDRENAQILNGTGVTPNLLGLTIAPGVLTVPSAGTDLDAIAAAFLALRTGAGDCEPTRS
jgi:hypothetical protein